MLIGSDFWHPLPKAQDTKLSLSVELRRPWHPHTHTHTAHTHQGPAVERSVTMAEFSNWLWTAASAKKPRSCRKPVSVWHLLPSLTSAGQPDVKHLGRDIILPPSPPLSTCYSGFRRLLLLELIILLSVLRQQKWPVFPPPSYENITLHVEPNKRRRESDFFQSNRATDEGKKSRGDTDAARGWLIPTVYQTAISEHRELFI